MQISINKPPGPHKQNSIRDTHMHKRKESKHNTKYSHQITKEERKKKGRKKTYKNKSRTINQMAVRIYISIITLNVNG